MIPYRTVHETNLQTLHQKLIPKILTALHQKPAFTHLMNEPLLNTVFQKSSQIEKAITLSEKEEGRCKSGSNLNCIIPRRKKSITGRELELFDSVRFSLPSFSSLCAERSGQAKESHR